MKRTCLHTITNTDEQNSCELHLVEQLIEKRILDPKDIPFVKSFVRMNRLKLIYFFLIIVSIVSCNKDEKFADPNYPTTLTYKTNAELEQVYAELVNSPLYNCTAINDFGFANDYITDTALCKVRKLSRSVFTENELVSMAKKTLTDYKNLVGVVNPLELQMQEIYTLSGLTYTRFDSIKHSKIEKADTAPPAWVVWFNPQNYNGLEVRGTSLQVRVDSQQVYAIHGNWYPQIYVPTTDYVTEEQAQNSLIGNEITYKNSSYYPTWDATWDITRKIILPIKKSKTIELRVCWLFRVNNWEITIDTQSGMIVSTVNLSAI